MAKSPLTPYARKIVVIGPESTGKSTLSKALADYFDTEWVREYAREYIENLGRPYEKTDLVKIAEQQIKAEDRQLSLAKNDLLICDTDLYVIKVWSEHKYGDCHDYILKEIARRQYDYYLLTSIDMPWEYDPQREYPDVAMRQYFFNIYKDIVAQSGVPWSIISGNEEERLHKSIAIIKRLSFK